MKFTEPGVNHQGLPPESPEKCSLNKLGETRNHHQGTNATCQSLGLAIFPCNGWFLWWTPIIYTWIFPWYVTFGKPFRLVFGGEFQHKFYTLGRSRYMQIVLHISNCSSHRLKGIYTKQTTKTWFNDDHTIAVSPCGFLVPVDGYTYIRRQYVCRMLYTLSW